MKGPFKSQRLEQLVDIQVENRKIKLLFDGETSFLKTIRSKISGRSTPCAMQFAAYPSSMFHSGAYLFMPDPNAVEPQIDVLKGFSGKPQIFIISGPVMSEVSVVYSQLLVHFSQKVGGCRLDGIDFGHGAGAKLPGTRVLHSIQNGNT